MDDRKIFECVAKIPGIRAVQIQDMLDMELAEVSESLKSLVDAGDLVRRSGFAPNGVAAQCYDFSDYFKTTNEYKAVMASMVPQAATGQAGAAADQPAKVGEVPSRAERAVAFILKTGGATDDELRAELVLKSTEYPSGILGHAMKTGKVTRKGNRWIPGDGRPVLQPPPKSFNRQPVSTIEKLVPAPTPEQAVVVPQFLADRVPAPKPAPTPRPRVVADPVPEAPPAPVAEVVALPPTLRCGIWSDGVIELQRNGKPVAVLMQDEADFMTAFLAGLRAA